MLLKVRGLIVELEILVLRGGVKVKCPFCENIDTKVIDSRPTEEGHAIRRRRECDNCRKRFTTYEKVEEIPMMVVKKDGSREVFDRNKVLNGIIKACEKRPVSMNEIEKIVDEIESRVIGEVIMDQLKGIDEVAYVRFASVYRQFKDINTFISELEKLLNDSKK